MNRIKKYWSGLLILVTLVSSVQFVYSQNTGWEEIISLTVTTIEPEYTVFVGAGFLNIETENSWGKATLYVPETHKGPVRLEIYKRNQISATWKWSIKEHTTQTWNYRKFDYIMDTYICEDNDGRTITVYVHGYYWDRRQNIYATIIEQRAAFQGQINYNTNRIK